MNEPLDQCARLRPVGERQKATLAGILLVERPFEAMNVAALLLPTKDIKSVLLVHTTIGMHRFKHSTQDSR